MKAKYDPRYPFVIKGNFDDLPKEPDRDKVNKDFEEAKKQLMEWSRKQWNGTENKMSKADRLLLEQGYKEAKSPFTDWFVFFNEETGTSLTFKDDIKSMHTKYEIDLTGDLLMAINEKIRELGWWDGYMSEADKLLEKMGYNNIEHENVSYYFNPTSKTNIIFLHNSKSIHLRSFNKHNEFEVDRELLEAIDLKTKEKGW